MCKSIVKKSHLPTCYIACCSGLLVTKDIYTVAGDQCTQFSYLNYSLGIF